MFKNIYPLFERKRLLKKETLENLRDYPRNIVQIMYQNYSDGILSGCKLTVDEDEIMIQPGILYHNKIPYILENSWRLPYEATGKPSYLKVKFTDKAAGIGQDEFLSQIYCDDRLPDSNYEMELARFKLQPGARLRYEYTGFFDFNTEFDTINRIYVPYSSPRKHSINPEILERFAYALMEEPIQNQFDAAFCLACMRVETTMPYDEINLYLNMRLNQTRKEYSNQEIYEGLSRILLEACGNKAKNNRPQDGEKKLLLL